MMRAPGQGGMHLAGGIYAVEFRHRDIHQHQIGFEFRNHLNGIAAVRRFTDHVQVWRGLQQRADARPHQGMVFHDKHIEDHTCSLRFS